MRKNRNCLPACVWTMAWPLSVPLKTAAEKAGRAYGDDRFRGWWESAPGCLGKATTDCVKPAELEELRYQQPRPPPQGLYLVALAVRGSSDLAVVVVEVSVRVLGLAGRLVREAAAVERVAKMF